MRVQRVVNDEGAVAVLVGLMAVFLTGMLAFAVDLGNAYSVQRRLSTAADGAALAAAQELGNRNAACGAGVTASDRSAGRTVADDYSSNRNAPGSALQAGAAGFGLACPSGSGGLVTVRNSKRVDFTFGNLFGVGNVQPDGEATARYGLLESMTGLRPFGLCTKSAEVALLIASGVTFPNNDEASFALRPTVRIVVDKTKNGACGPSPGNWGVLDLDGGSNPLGDIRDWIEFGHRGVLDILDDNLSGDPGIPSGGSLESQMNSIVGDTIILPMYDRVFAGGNGAKFHITGFVSATVCGWKFGNKSSSLVLPCSIPGPVGGANAPDFIDLRYRQSYSVGDFASCGTPCTTHGVLGVALVPTP